MVTTGEFTAEALAFAKGKPIRLMNSPALWQIVQGAKVEEEGGTGKETGARRRVSESRRAESTPPLPEVPASTSTPITVSAASAPACPLCGGAMIRRTARRGPKEGTAFWGCERFPDCRGSRMID